jgi:hypothetical protein
MSIIDGDINNRISIHFFDTGSQLKRILHITILNSHYTLLVGENIQFDDPSLSIGHFLRTTTRTCQRNWERLLDGTLNYFLIPFRDFVQVRSRLNLADVKILIYEESVVTRIESLDASQIIVFLTPAQFLRLKIIIDSFWTVAFKHSHSPAFPDVRQYSRYRFVFMDRIREIAVSEFPFPHMRSSQCSTIVTFI